MLVYLLLIICAAQLAFRFQCCCVGLLNVFQVAYLYLIDGATIKDLVNRTMNKLLHPEFAKQFAWVGRLTKKHAFKVVTPVLMK